MCVRRRPPPKPPSDYDVGLRDGASAAYEFLYSNCTVAESVLISIIASRRSRLTLTPTEHKMRLKALDQVLTICAQNGWPAAERCDAADEIEETPEIAERVAKEVEKERERHRRMQKARDDLRVGNPRALRPTSAKGVEHV